MKNEFILLSFFLNDNSYGKPLNLLGLNKAISSNDLTWVHIDGNNPQSKKWLEEEISEFDPFIVEELIADETRPRLIEINDGALLILRGVNLNQNSSPEDMVSIRIWIDKNKIISVQKRPLKAITDLENRIKSNKGPRNSAEFIATLIKLLFDRMEPILGELDERTDISEEKVLENADLSLREEMKTSA